MAAKIEVTIADQNPVVRAGLDALIERDGRFRVCGVHSSGEALINALKAKPVEIAVVGWTLPDMTGGAVLARVKEEKWQTRIIIYTGERSSEVLRQAIKGGAWGFVSKTEDPQVLLEAVVSVARGRLSLPIRRYRPSQPRSARRFDGARTRIACCTCERLDQPADRGAHRHLA